MRTSAEVDVERRLGGPAALGLVVLGSRDFVVPREAAERFARGGMDAGARLPSLRRCAAHLGVSKSTVVEAYDRLVAEDEITARRGSGFYAARRAPPAAPASPEPWTEREVDPLWVMRGSARSGPAAAGSPRASCPRMRSGARCAPRPGARRRRLPALPEGRGHEGRARKHQATDAEVGVAYLLGVDLDTPELRDEEHVEGVRVEPHRPAEVERGRDDADGGAGRGAERDGHLEGQGLAHKLRSFAREVGRGAQRTTTSRSTGTVTAAPWGTWIVGAMAVERGGGRAAHRVAGVDHEAHARAVAERGRGGLGRAADHPTRAALGNVVTVSNVQAGTEPAWFLMDTSRAILPLIWQVRDDYEFQSLTRPDHSHVFMTDEHLYGIRARVNAGFGLWQLAFGSKAPLTPENHKAARAAMSRIRGNQGRLMGVRPTTLVVPTVLEEAARLIVGSELNDGGSNPWKGTAELVATPCLDD